MADMARKQKGAVAPVAGGHRLRDLSSAYDSANV
jgi:hypothetical protein